MKKAIIINLFIILIGCNSEPSRQEIMVNKTVKVISKDYHDKAENYTFKWQSPIGPNNKKISFDLKKDMLIFTPEIEGYYEVALTIEDISNEIVEKQIFYYVAIPETSEVAILNSKITEEPTITKNSNKVINGEKTKTKIKNKEKQLSNSKKTKINSKKKPKKKKDRLAKKKTKKTTNNKMDIKDIEYVLQISAWPSLEEARRHQLELIDLGFDVYTQRYYI